MFTFAWFFSNQNTNDKLVDGEVGLRAYFYRGDNYQGDGSLEYPHEIVTPTHFYNLTRLQNLGVFPEKTYFRVGHVFQGHEEEGPKCLNGETKVDILDMTSYCASSPLLPIGSEGTPFYGYFDGNYIPIIGLRVAGNPEDVGVFGYTAYTSEVKNIVCSNLEVSSLGYSTTDASSFLYSEVIEQIFSQEASNFELASLSFVSTYDEQNHNHPLKQVEPFTVTDLLAKSEVIDNESSEFYGERIVKGEFIPSFPTISGHESIEYKVTSSTGVIRLEEGTNNLVLDLDKLPNEFNSNSPVKMNSNISLVASVKLNGIKYSRVIQSYSVEIKYAPIVEDGDNVLSMTVNCDHIYDDQANPINFGHGNNVGYLVGHADGNVDHCYVYNGTLLLNTNNAGLQRVETQTEMGLVGKVGNNVTTDIDPTNTSTKRGETGVLNFSHVYSLIREPFEVGDQTFAGYQETYSTSTHSLTGEKKTFISYAIDQVDQGTGKYLPRGSVSDKFNLYKEYLRTDTANPKHYITSAGSQQDIIDNNNGAGSAYTIPSGTLAKEMNAVDFAYNKVICDGTTVSEDRGLGVFKIVTTYSSLANDPDLASAIWRNDIGSCSITHDSESEAKTKIYFSTAECDWTKGNGWAGNGSVSPAIMNTLPSFSNAGSFQYPFSRDFNYMFRLDLSEAANFKKGHDIYNYMYDTDNAFLKNYLSSILIDRLGKPVVWKNKGFGFKVQFSQDSLAPVTKLDSYMTVGKPTSLNQYTVNGDTKYFPQKSIVFSIDNPNGANVSIAGTGGYISIYRYNPDSQSEPITELYTMRSYRHGGQNMGRFFPYSSNGVTNTSSIVMPTGGNMVDNDFLYGHIFKLPRGNYVIGSSIKMNSNSAKVYYVCVQGQTNGDLGDLDVATIGNYVHDVDFLVKDPADENDPFDVNDSSFFAEFSFAGNFTDVIGKMVVDTYEESGTVYIRTRFNDFITSLLFYCRKTNPAFVINSGEPIEGEPLYNGPYDNFTNWGS